MESETWNNELQNLAEYLNGRSLPYSELLALLESVKFVILQEVYFAQDISILKERLGYIEDKMAEVFEYGKKSKD